MICTIGMIVSTLWMLQHSHPYTYADIVGRRLLQCDTRRVTPEDFSITVGQEERVALYFYYLGLEVLRDNADLYSISLQDIEKTVITANPSFLQVEGDPIHIDYNDDNTGGYEWSYGVGGLEKRFIDDFRDYLLGIMNINGC